MPEGGRSAQSERDHRWSTLTTENPVRPKEGRRRWGEARASDTRVSALRMTRDDVTSVIVDVPGMYADHHVVEVRRILLEVPGVQDVYASSAFGVVEIGFDPEQTSAEALERRLEEAGYRSELPVPAESGEPATDKTSAESRYRRRTTSGVPPGSAVAFRQELREPAPPGDESNETTEE